jgi:phosphoglucosamine mutase
VERIFGTDGVRGEANTDLTPELAVRLGRAIVTVLREEGVERPAITIGRDPRWSGDMLQAALTAGVTSAGGDAIDLGVVPTPAVAHLTATSDAHAGAVISASHNPVQDNGIKFFGRDGFKLSDAEEDRLEELLHEPNGARPVATGVGRRYEDVAAVGRYVDHLVAAADADLTGMRIVVDGANGAASTVAPQVYRHLGAEVVAINVDPDGANINAGCGSTHPEVVVAATVAHGADIGIAHDGDADRLICAAADGTEVDGDVILAILAKDLHDHGGLPQNAVATTVMTNLGFRQAMDRLGIRVVTTKVGDRYVLEAMRAEGLNLGGEQSGHLITLDHATTGDGILSAVRLLTAMRRNGATLLDLAAVMTRLPQVLVNVPRVDRAGLDGCDEVWAVVRDVEAELGDGGRVLVRPSGTEPLIRVMCEAPTADAAQSAADRIAAVVARALAPA